MTFNHVTQRLLRLGGAGVFVRARPKVQIAGGQQQSSSVWCVYVCKSKRACSTLRVCKCLCEIAALKCEQDCLGVSVSPPFSWGLNYGYYPSAWVLAQVSVSAAGADLCAHATWSMFNINVCRRVRITNSNRQSGLYDLTLAKQGARCFKTLVRPTHRRTRLECGMCVCVCYLCAYGLARFVVRYAKLSAHKHT